MHAHDTEIQQKNKWVSGCMCVCACECVEHSLISRPNTKVCAPAYTGDNTTNVRTQKIDTYTRTDKHTYTRNQVWQSGQGGAGGE